MFLLHFDTLGDESSIRNSTGITDGDAGVFLKGFLRESRAKLEEQLSQQNVEGYDYMRITFIYKFLRSHTNCFMEGLPPIFSDYKLVKNIDIATYKIEAGVTKMKQKRIKA